MKKVKVYQIIDIIVKFTITLKKPQYFNEQQILDIFHISSSSYTTNMVTCLRHMNHIPL